MSANNLAAQQSVLDEIRVYFQEYIDSDFKKVASLKKAQELLKPYFDKNSKADLGIAQPSNLELNRLKQLIDITADNLEIKNSLHGGDVDNFLTTALMLSGWKEDLFGFGENDNRWDADCDAIMNKLLSKVFVSEIVPAMVYTHLPKVGRSDDNKTFYYYRACPALKQNDGTYKTIDTPNPIAPDGTEISQELIINKSNPSLSVKKFAVKVVDPDPNKKIFPYLGQIIPKLSIKADVEQDKAVLNFVKDYVKIFKKVCGTKNLNMGVNDLNKIFGIMRDEKLKNSLAKLAKETMKNYNFGLDHLIQISQDTIRNYYTQASILSMMGIPIESIRMSSEDNIFAEKVNASHWAGPNAEHFDLSSTKVVTVKNRQQVTEYAAATRNEKFSPSKIRDGIVKSFDNLVNIVFPESTHSISMLSSINKKSSKKKAYEFHQGGVTEANNPGQYSDVIMLGTTDPAANIFGGPFNHVISDLSKDYVAQMGSKKQKTLVLYTQIPKGNLLFNISKSPVYQQVINGDLKNVDSGIQLATRLQESFEAIKLSPTETSFNPGLFIMNELAQCEKVAKSIIVPAFLDEKGTISFDAREFNCLSVKPDVWKELDKFLAQVDESARLFMTKEKDGKIIEEPKPGAIYDLLTVHRETFKMALDKWEKSLLEPEQRHKHGYS